jgi:hypothetical protein
VIISIINDNTRRLAAWSKALSTLDVRTYTHPNYLLSDLYLATHEDNTTFVYVFDRIFYGTDVLKEPSFAEIKKLSSNHKSLFLLSSAHHEPGERVYGFDLVIPAKPIEVNEFLQYVKEAV